MCNSHINRHKSPYRATFFLIFLFCIIGCKKLAEVSPPITNITSTRAYSNDGNAISVLTGLYINMQGTFAGATGLGLYSGLSADELSLYDAVSSTNPENYYYKNSLFIKPGTSNDIFWSSLYNYIYNCNAALEGISGSTTLTSIVKKQLLGEALFLRAFCYYYLVNLYGDVPLSLHTNYQENSHLPKTTAIYIYQQLSVDLDSARLLLSPNYLDATLLKSSTDRVRPTQAAATALLARVYLYLKKWQQAEMMATALINNTSLYQLSPLQDVFLKNSPEAIWQLQPVLFGWNTLDAQAFILPPTGPDGYFYTTYLSNRLLNSFEAHDERRKVWVDSINVAGNTYYYPYKYKSANYGDPVTEYQMMLRLGEQYLIRAEARTQQGNLDGASADLNVIRQRAGLPNTNANTKLTLLTAILQERKVELFTELGQRWLDLKRTGTIDSVMRIETPLKSNGEPWHSYQQLYPLPLTDLLANPNLEQNQGY